VELAEKIGIVQTIVSAIEKGALKLSAGMAVRFAVALGVSTDCVIRKSEANWAVDLLEKTNPLQFGAGSAYDS